MPSTTYNCPDCKKENRLILLGNDYGSFEQKCKKCSSKIEVEIDKKQNVSNVRSKRNTAMQFEEKLYNSEYIKEHTLGFDELKMHIKVFTPKKKEKIKP